MMRWIFTLLLAGGIYTAMRSVDMPPAQTDVQGSAYVYDGDTFTVAGTKIRLFGKFISWFKRI